MFCVNCGKELDEGKRYCSFCGADQAQGPGGQAAGQEPGAVSPASPSGGMKTVTKVVIAIVAILIVIGATVGIVFAVVKSPGKKSGTTKNNVKPASEKVAFISSGDIYTISLGGSGQKQITDRGDIVDFCVSPDGSKIAFVALLGDTRYVSVMDSDGTNITRVTQPEDGQADNPTFDPDGKHLYYTLVTPQAISDIEAGTPFSEEFQRYDISTGTADLVYSHGDMMEQSISGLYADPGGDALYFNLYGSDWPSSRPHKLDLGATVTETEYLPMITDDGVYVAAAYRVMGLSKKGNYVFCFKDALISDPTGDSDRQEQDACYLNINGTGEVSVASSDLQVSEDGKIEGMEFSRVSNPRYYFGRVSNTNAEGTSATLDFYKGDAESSVKPIQTSLGIMIQKDQGMDAVWHLLPVGNN